MFNHLKDSHESYFSHCRWAITAGVKMILAGILSIIHGLLPNLFAFTSAKTIIDLYYGRLHNHRNVKYQKYAKEQAKKHNLTNPG